MYVAIVAIKTNLFRGPMEKNRSARKYTALIVKALCAMISHGLSLRRAGERLHIHHSTVAEWKNKYPDFAESIAAAESAFVSSQLAKIEKAADNGSWQAAAWLLERRFAVEFSQPQIQMAQANVHIAFEDLGEVVKRAQASPETMRALAMMSERIG